MLNFDSNSSPENLTKTSTSYTIEIQNRMTLKNNILGQKKNQAI